MKNYKYGGIATEKVATSESHFYNYEDLLE